MASVVGNGHGTGVNAGTGARQSLTAGPPSNSRRPSRESTLESAGQAADIFDLYGIDSSSYGDGVRESWHGNGRYSAAYEHGQGVEELQDDTSFPGEIDLGTPNGSSTPIRSNGTPTGQERWSSIAYGNGTPDISVTDTSPIATTTTTNGQRSLDIPTLGNEVGERPVITSRTSSLTQPNSKRSSIASFSTEHNSPVKNKDIARLSPSPRHSAIMKTMTNERVRLSNGTDNSVTLSLAPSSSTSGGEGIRSRNGSQASIAASAQYPGEENDAFYVRSTYARLDNEGVHGDGWDPGVERTRGGPVGGKRATVFTPSKTGAIGEQEREFLASLDRYGFVNEPLRNRSETRVALIPTAPLRRIPKLPHSSPLAGQPPTQPNSHFSPSDSGPSPRIPSSPKLDQSEEDRRKRKEDERIGKWANMMSIKDRDNGGNIVQWEWRREGQGAKLPRRVYKGIPDRWRMAAWWTLAEDQAVRSPKKGKGTKTVMEIEQDYRNTIDLPSTFDVQIDLDVPRTISGHTMFVTRYGAGQRNLWHVLHCFGQVCETCGYVQGMGPIAATLLCYFDPERAYTLLVRLHDVYGMHDIFEPGFPGLLEAFYVQERLMEWLMPDVYKSFQRNMISSSSWGTKWYITLFVNTVPFSQQLRLWDALWLDGRDVMIMTSIALLWAFKDLLAAPNATFESILSLLSSYFVAEDEDALMIWLRKMINLPGIKSKMDGWREEWHSLVREGKSGQALL